jgi:hypothetical protein
MRDIRTYWTIEGLFLREWYQLQAYGSLKAAVSEYDRLLECDTDDIGFEKYRITERSYSERVFREGVPQPCKLEAYRIALFCCD